MRILLFKVLNLSLDEPLDELMTKMRNSVYFMGSTATISLDELLTQILEYATIVGNVQDIIGKPLPITSKYYMMYLCHLFYLDPNLYGLVPRKH